MREEHTHVRLGAPPQTIVPAFIPIEESEVNSTPPSPQSFLIDLGRPPIALLAYVGRTISGNPLKTHSRGSAYHVILENAIQRH